MRKSLPVLVLSTLLLINLTGCSQTAQTAAPPGPAVAAAGQAQTVAVLKLEKAPLTHQISVVGKVLPLEEVKVSPKAAGRVGRALKDVGQEVNAGETLFELENSDITITTEKTRVQLEDAKRNLERKEALYTAKAIAKAELDTAQSAYDTLRLTLQQNENDLANTQIKSPIRGIVTAKNVNLGESVTSSTAAYTVVNIDKVQINASLLEDEVNYVKGGNPVNISVPAVSNQVYKGTVAKIAPYASDKDKTYPLWVEAENPGRVMKPGMFAEVKLQYNRLEAALAVPKDAIVDRGGKKVVYVANGDKAVERQVKTGITLSGQTEIQQGLNPGELLITSGLNTMKDGKPISIKGEGK